MRATRTAMVGVAAAILLGQQVLAATPSSADHSDQPYYGVPWISAGSQDRIVDWRFDNGVPANMRTIIRSAADVWTNLPQQYMYFLYSSGSADYTSTEWNQCTSTYQRNAVGYGDIVSGQTDPYLAVTQTCPRSNSDGSYSLNQFKMLISNDQPFDVDGGFVPPGQYDLYSVMTHEFGHATGRTSVLIQNAGHYPASDSVACSPTIPNDRSTMCENPYPTSAQYGRTLSSHDQSSFNAVGGYD